MFQLELIRWQVPLFLLNCSLRVSVFTNFLLSLFTATDQQAKICHANHELLRTLD